MGARFVTILFNYYNILWPGQTLESWVFEEWRTTVMLRNMPNHYTRDMLLELVDSMGFEGCYDFAYLPVVFKPQAGLGYPGPGAWDVVFTCFQLLAEQR